MPSSARYDSAERQGVLHCAGLAQVCLVVCLLCASFPSFATEHESFDMQIQDRVLLEFQSTRDGLGAAGQTSLVQRHAGLLQQVLRELPAEPGVQFRVKVVALPGISEIAVQQNTPLPAGAGAISPWLSLAAPDPATFELELYVSELRVIYDQHLAEDPAAWETYDRKISFAPVSVACLSDLAELYTEAVSFGHPAPDDLFRQTCLEDVLAPHFLALFQSAPQNFFGPFEYVVLEHIKRVEAESDGFYRALYAALLTQGLAELRSGAVADPDWWRPALRGMRR